MQVTNDKGLTLYHIQVLSEVSDEPVDLFVWSGTAPSRLEVRRILEIEYLNYIDDMMNNYNVYPVWVEV